MIDQFILTVANLEVYTYLSLNAPYPNITECVNTGLKCVATERTAVRAGRKKDLGGLSTAVFAIDDDRIGMDVTNSAANPKSDIPVPMEMGNMGAGHLGQVGPVEYYNEEDYSWAEEVENDYPSWDDAGAEAMSMLRSRVGVAVMQNRLYAIGGEVSSVILRRKYKGDIQVTTGRRD